MQSITAYQEELQAKRIYYAHMKAQYPELPFQEQDIHSFTLQGMKIEITKGLEHAKILGACLKIQRNFRNFYEKNKAWRKLQVKIDAIQKIQRAWKNTRWVRIMKIMMKKKRHDRVCMI